ncbi:MAG: hypothetical protein C0592_14245 [Marinilabiliales bacterium]|nr:MAG: hypothetical protein C0592_14245 [Marinilabiliales bacterium]
MKRISRILIVISIAVFVAACSNAKEQLIDDIKAKEQIVSESIGDQFDKSTAESLRQDYLQFANEYPDDSLAPVFMHKASELAINLNMPQEAVSTIDSLIIKFPDYQFLPDAWFFKGFIQETYLNDEAGALKTYETFIEKFPKHEMVPQVQFSIENMGVSEEELIKQFMQNTQNQDTISMMPDSV